jgi:low affinity Fe/Cu permease
MKNVGRADFMPVVSRNTSAPEEASSAKGVLQVGAQKPAGSRATRVVSTLTGWLGSFPAIIGSIFVVLLWAAYLPLVKDGFLNTNYQLLINTTTTIVTFIMVFIIQSTQNRDGRALQTKLDAILDAIEGDHAHLMGLEDLPEKAIKQVQTQVHDDSSDPEPSTGLEGAVSRY